LIFTGFMHSEANEASARVSAENFPEGQMEKRLKNSTKGY